MVLVVKSVQCILAKLVVVRYGEYAVLVWKHQTTKLKQKAPISKLIGAMEMLAWIVT